jgi:hypothetical protein
MSRDIARIVFTAADECTMVVETTESQFRFSVSEEGDPIWIDYDDVPQLVAFLLAMKGE